MRILLATALLLGLVSCQQREETTDAVAYKGTEAPERSEVALTSAAAPPTRAASARMIIRNAQVRLVVTDAVTAARALTAFAESIGGYATESRQWQENDQTRAALIIRVPANELNRALAEARKFAVRVESENVSGQDVTEEFTDLGAQLINLEAAEAELRQLLTTVRQRTQKAADILEIYTELSRVRGEIERLRGRMKYLSQLSALATIQMELIPDAIVKPVVQPGWQPVAVVREATRALLGTLKWAAETAIWLIIYVLPLVLIVCAVLFALGASIRRLRGTVHASSIRLSS